MKQPTGVPLPVENTEAKRVLEDYIKVVRRRLGQLPSQQRHDILAEIRSHLLELYTENTGNAVHRARAAIDRLGDPQSFIPDLIAQSQQDHKLRYGHPSAVARALTRTAGSSLFDGLITIVLGVAMLFCVLLLILALYTMANPDAGLWIYPGGGFSLSFENQPGAEQLFRSHFWWLGGLGAILGYGLLTAALRWWQKWRRSYWR